MTQKRKIIPYNNTIQPKAEAFGNSITKKHDLIGSIVVGQNKTEGINHFLPHADAEAHIFRGGKGATSMSLS